MSATTTRKYTGKRFVVKHRVDAAARLMGWAIFDKATGEWVNIPAHSVSSICHPDVIADAAKPQPVTAFKATAVSFANKMNAAV